MSQAASTRTKSDKQKIRLVIIISDSRPSEQGSNKRAEQITKILLRIYVKVHQRGPTLMDDIQLQGGGISVNFSNPILCNIFL